MTIQITALATALGPAIGIDGAGLKLIGFRPQTLLVNLYVESNRNTPLLVQLFVAFFSLPSFGIRVSAFAAGTIALGIDRGTYAVAVMRGGIEAIHKG